MTSEQKDILSCEQALLSRLSRVGEVSGAASQKLIDKMSIYELPKNDLFIKKGQHFDKVIYVVSGLIESSMIAESGKKVVHRIFKAGDFVFDYQSLMEKTGAKLNYKTIGHSQIIVFNIDDLTRIIEQHSELLLHVMNIGMEELVFLQDKVINEMSTDTSEKYQEFLKEYSPVMSLLSNKKIAEYLGVTEQGLHKVRTKLKKQEPTMNGPQI